MSEGKPNYVIIHSRDNVATATAGISKGTEFTIEAIEQTILIKNDIEFGHKFAVNLIKSGEDIIKYGEIIGVAIIDIEPGEHVHVHNLNGKRGRGDIHNGGN